MTEFHPQADELDMRLAQHERKPIPWSLPVEFDLSDREAREELENRFVTGEVRTVFDPIESIANDLYEYNNPDGKEDAERRHEFVTDIVRQGSRYGKWFFFPWSGELARYPDVQEHRDLRTSRNRYLITDNEQAKLYDSTVAVFGLSVGSKVVESLVSSGIGGKVIMGDPDTIEPSNLNRLSGGFASVGTFKLDHAAKQISEIDPYIEQVHFAQGVTADNLTQLAAHQPDILFDEVDDLSMKAALRQFAQELRVPVVMATDLGDRSLIDVERYDQEGAKLFNGRLSSEQTAALAEGTVSPEELQKLMLKIVGLRHVTSRMLQSVMQVNRHIAGLPQLGTTAAIGGAYAAIAAREIILDRPLESGRYVSSPKNILNLQPQATVLGGIKTVINFARKATPPPPDPVTRRV